MSRTLLVTGASGGIGLEVTRQAVAKGADVLVVALGEAKLCSVAAALNCPGKVEIAPLDLSDAAALELFLGRLDARGYVPDVLVNNAGQGVAGSFVDTDWSRIDQTLQVNMNALARLGHWAARVMKARGSGAIVNMSAALATRPVPYFAAYAASKAFVNNLSQAMNSELRAHGVSVSAIHPPAVRTSFADAARADLNSTLVSKLFPSVGPATVARAVLRAADQHRRSVMVGLIAGIVMATVPITPRGLDLAFMTFLFRSRRAAV